MRTAVTAYIMKGGPLNAVTLYLTGPGTITFSLRGQTGFYNSKNEWVAK